ncbi:hypothetical protein SAMN05444487_101422 [Marininema mesophilum]|uniref:Uncharacterized protein n=1 Tax=Marininema mesophilum TaxID=1048340 RepID=A0A1H2RAK8_9BACL|nr:hypothetical protein [Marininema mesophilum]SDW16447.1 hypothetical protein SAMN05444487_101422 [Marininema mesophilum]
MVVRVIYNPVNGDPVDVADLRRGDVEIFNGGAPPSPTIENKRLRVIPVPPNTLVIVIGKSARGCKQGAALCIHPKSGRRTAKKLILLKIKPGQRILCKAVQRR